MVVTTEQTGKSWKALILLAWVLIIIGGIIALATEGGMGGLITLAIGGCIYLLAKFGAWWEHG